ncbi:hypothetical protein [Proteus penneri]|uniref:hypothetical protein n=1 Tax=Proteus penneri TaxID=102862 RepID=UPI00288950A6|nr:hypothetical protein [Proteus penneri]
MKYKLWKYIDQFLFALINIGTILFISKFINEHEASKYIYVTTFTSLSLVVNAAFIISPTWYYCTNIEKLKEYHSFNLLLLILSSIIVSIFIYNFMREKNLFLSINIFLLCLLFPLFDYLRRILYILKDEKKAGISSLLLVCITLASYLILKFIYNIEEYTYYISYLILSLATSALFIITNIKLKYKINFHIKMLFSPQKLKNYINLGKWSALSMLCFWISTQGIFIIFNNHISDQAFVISKVCLSFSSIIAIFFSAIENNLMPSLRKNIINNDFVNIEKIKIKYFKNGFFISILFSFISISSYFLLYKFNYTALFTILMLCFYQAFSGIFKIYAYLLKSINKYNLIFYINSFCTIVILTSASILLDKSNYIISITILFFGISTSVLYKIALYFHLR